ncbi:MAG TPA: hypothetical protein VM345_00330 [Acidimicrobiales bacterium]|nr:hypothetical protein [Acidimicrobiales bacterium]
MIGEFERPVRRRAGQDRALRRYLTTRVAPYSAHYRDILLRTPVHGVADLERLPFATLDDAPDAESIVLRPSADRIVSAGDLRLKVRFWSARFWHRVSTFNRTEIEPAFKPIHWHLASTSGGRVLPIGYSADDLDRLGEVGRSMLEMAGVEPLDVLVAIEPPSPTPAFWQIAFGARRAGISSLFVDAGSRPDTLAGFGPHVLAGRADDLLRMLDRGRAEGLSFATLRTLIVIGAPLDPVVRDRLAHLGGSASRPAAVVAAWAPEGTRAVWAECRNGTDVHTWPAYEVLELVDPVTGEQVPPGSEGEVVYTPLGWNGSVLLRLRTGVVGCLDDTPCVSCGRTSPRVRVVASTPPFSRILDEHADVEAWQAELRLVDDAEELIVFITPRRSGHPGRLLRELDRQLSATQFVVLDRAQLAERLERHGGAKVVDLRG